MPPSCAACLSVPAGAARGAAARGQLAGHRGGAAPAAGQPAGGMRVASPESSPARLLPGAAAACLPHACVVPWNRHAGGCAAHIQRPSGDMPCSAQHSSSELPICRRVARSHWSLCGSSRRPGSRCAAASSFQLRCCLSSWLKSSTREAANAARLVVRRSSSRTAAWTKVRVPALTCLVALLLPLPNCAKSACPSSSALSLLCSDQPCVGRPDI